MYKPILTYKSRNPFYSSPFNDFEHGDFNITNSYWKWVSCRETFHNHSFKKDTKYFYAAVRPGCVRAIVKFIAKFESKMDLSRKDRIRFVGYRDNNQVLKIKVSKFWRQNEARRQLLTILLRVPSRRYKSKKFNSSLRKSRYLRKTMGAVKRFMAGKHRFDDDGMTGFNGWKSVFKNDKNIKLLKS